MAKRPHPEDIKAELRKKHGSLVNFERARGLPANSVRDVLRGKSRTAVAEAIARELDTSIQALFPGRYIVSHIVDTSSPNRRAQLLNAEAA